MRKSLKLALSANYDRRNFFRSVAAASLVLVVVPPVVTSIVTPAEAASGNYVVGCVKPLRKPPIGIPDETIVDLLKLLPPDIKILPDYIGLTKGTKKEMQDSLGDYKNNVAYLASQNCDLISIEGAPPFMILGLHGETALIDGWEKEYKTPMFTSSQNQIDAFKAVNAKNIFGVTEFTGKINKSYADYFISAGYNVVAMDGMPGISFAKLQDVTSEQVYNFIKRNFLKQKGADTIYLLGSAWRTLDIIEPLERELGVPVIHPVVARAWEIQRRLNIHYPISGYGRLLATLPA
jgi:maleate isomerase